MARGRIQRISIVNKSGLPALCVEWDLEIKYDPKSLVVLDRIPLWYNGYKLITSQEAQDAAEKYLDEHHSGWRKF